MARYLAEDALVALGFVVEVLDALHACGLTLVDERLFVRGALRGCLLRGIIVIRLVRHCVHHFHEKGFGMDKFR